MSSKNDLPKDFYKAISNIVQFIDLADSRKKSENKHK